MNMESPTLVGSRCGGCTSVMCLRISLTDMALVCSTAVLENFRHETHVAH